MHTSGLIIDNEPPVLGVFQDQAASKVDHETDKRNVFQLADPLFCFARPRYALNASKKLDYFRYEV